MESFNSKEEYYESLKKRASLPNGFLVSTTSIKFQPAEKQEVMRMCLSLILLERETPLFGAVFTRNRFPGAPVLIGRERMGEDTLRGILINNKIANVGAPKGVEDARSLLKRLGQIAGTPWHQFLPASTGIIGWKLPVREMEQALPGLIEGLKAGSILSVAEAIMTTDSFPKIREAGLGQGRILGIAKGAGMIEPNMATMLAFIMTDIAVDRTALRDCLHHCVKHSFNRISVDGDQSTSDMAVLVSSGVRPPVSSAAFKKALMSVCRDLSVDIVRNGEGVGHVIKVKILRGGEEDIASGAGKAIVNSPLVKTAVFGNDPNVGRIVSALGDYMGNAGLNFDSRLLSVHLGGIEVFSEGMFRLSPQKEKELSAYLKECSVDPTVRGFPQHERLVEIEVDLGRGGKPVEVLGADLSYEYIRENADYRS